MLTNQNTYASPLKGEAFFYSIVISIAATAAGGSVNISPVNFHCYLGFGFSGDIEHLRKFYFVISQIKLYLLRRIHIGVSEMQENFIFCF